MQKTKMTGIEWRAVFSLGTVLSLRMLGTLTVLPVLTTYGMALQGANESLIGLAIGVYGLVQACFQIPFGLFSDRIGCKPLIIIGLLIFALGSAIAALIDSIYGVIIGRALQGSGAISASVMALLSELTQEHNRTKAMACIGISFGVTFAAAMVIGPIVTHTISLKGLFWIITALALIGIGIILFVVPTTSRHSLNKKSNVVRGRFGKVLFNIPLLKLNFGIFCLHAMLMSSFVALPPMMNYAGLPPVNQWKVYLIVTLISFVTMVPFIAYAEIKQKTKRMFLSCVTLLLIAELILMTSEDRLWLIFSGMQLFFIAFNVLEALLPSLISKESSLGYRGTAMGIYLTSQFLGVAFGGTIGGWLFQYYGAWLVFLVFSGIALIWWLVSTTLREPLLSSLHIALPDSCLIELDEKLIVYLKSQLGVMEIFMPEKRIVCIKVNKKQINLVEFKKIIDILKCSLLTNDINQSSSKNKL
ncbi:MFS transporter [Candidatus Curculioniphilus buchneri]|uniref:MFS transporter n=1 Tax=Candidatus Curculioniphilus buchneri TaxID=690594 RepID=UPI00376EC732